MSLQEWLIYQIARFTVLVVFLTILSGLVGCKWVVMEPSDAYCSGQCLLYPRHEKIKYNKQTVAHGASIKIKCSC